MARSFCCPSCQVELAIPDGAEGKRLKCPKCAAKCSIPALEARTPSRRPAEAVAKKVKIPPSSGTVSSRRSSSDDLPLLPVDFSGLDDRPSSRDVNTTKRPGSSSPAVADVNAFFFDDEPPRPSSRRPSGELRKSSRLCTSCGGIVPMGMSLCNSCGFDLDTGQRIELVEEEVEEMGPPETSSGTPASILVIGLLCMVAAGALTVVSFFVTGGMGGMALGMISLFGVVASIMFTAGKSLKMLTVALMLGAIVNVITMIAVPVIVANTFDAVDKVEAVPGNGDVAQPESGEEKAEPHAPPKIQALADRLDTTKINWGIVILLIDAVVLAYINTPLVRQHFEPRYYYEEEGPIRI